MNTRIIDTSWHPLITGCPPRWASGWGQDQWGVFVEITLHEVTQRLRWIPPGQFWMGSPEKEPGRFNNESPHHQVTLTKGYWLFDTPCTQALWKAVIGENPSRFQSPMRPVEQVSWNDVQDFLKRINERIPGLDLDLSSEAQWEYACRVGTETAIYTGAWYYANSKDETHPVRLKRANPWGLYDMLGNVLEWTQDHWHGDYRDAPTDGSAWLSDDADADRVLRGGSWGSHARNVRAAFRSHDPPHYRDDDIGFRCARVQGAPD